ncbi:MAG: TolC family protein [Bryobacteraceae bacterium]|nr:TolC family protein [Bryobacteraceae bacterium]
MRVLCAALLFIATLSGEVLPLTLPKAIALATAKEGNLRLQLVRETIAQAEARKRLAFAAFLPNLDGSAAASSQTRNLQAFGIQFPRVPGVSFPTFAGPFTVVDYRATATQSILDLASLQRYKAAKALISVAELDAAHATNQTVQMVARAYVLALESEAGVDTAKANVALAQALVKLADNQKNAGMGTGIDVTRARVQLANEEQRLQVAASRRERAVLELLRVIGVDLALTVELNDRVNDGSEPLPPVEETLKTALAARQDLKAQQKRELVAGMNAKSINAERWPSLGAAGDYGVIGNGSDNMLPTRTIGVSLRVPVFDGGRRATRHAESGVLERQERLRAIDLAKQVELDVRVAMSILKSSRDQIAIARQGLELSENELAQAQRRFEAGVANSLELTDAQTRLSRARDNHLAALYQFNLARIDLAAAAGTIQEAVQNMGEQKR